MLHQGALPTAIQYPLPLFEEDLVMREVRGGGVHPVNDGKYFTSAISAAVSK